MAASMRLVGSGLRCVRGEHEVFQNLDLELGAGEALLVTGPNGAGKSSLLRVLAGLLRLTAGTLQLEAGNPELTIGEQAHYVGHFDPLKPSLTVAEHMQFWTDYLGGRGIAAAAALETVGLIELAGLPAGYLSAGQKRRLSVARLLAIKRPIWLLDEPISTIDASGQGDFTILMRNHLADGGLIAVATHAPLGLGGARALRLGPAGG